MGSLEDVIYNISPVDSPLFRMVRRYRRVGDRRIGRWQWEQLWWPRSRSFEKLKAKRKAMKRFRALVPKMPKVKRVGRK